MRAAHASTAIEGTPLTPEEVSQLSEGWYEMAARRAKAEVLNCLRVLDHIEPYQNNGQISEDHILALHCAITHDTVDDPATEGAFLKVRVVVGNRHTLALAPMMDALTSWLNSEAALNMHPVLVAGIAHYELVRIPSSLTATGGHPGTSRANPHYAGV